MTISDKKNTSLAENNSLPARSALFAPWPIFEKDEIDTVAKVLASGKVNYWTGEEARLFEKGFAEYCGCNYAVALANGTVALELALYALGVGEGDEVVVTPRTFIASASAIVMRGAKPVFADVDPESQNITVETILKVLTPKTKAIIAVHLAGWPCDMDPIMELAQEHGLKVIEDCAQAHGAVYEGRKVGSMGDMAAFSFCNDKIMTTGGEGGMLVTNNKELWEKAWSFKDHGKSYDAVYNTEHPSRYGFKWLHESFGTNWRMIEIQAALGRLQLEKLPEWSKKRRENARILTGFFKEIPAFRVTEPPENISHAYYKYYVFLRPEQLKDGWGRERIIDTINAEGVTCLSGSCSEIYLEKAFDEEGLRPATRLPVAKVLGETSLMFLVHPTLTDDNMKHTCTVVSKVMEEAQR